MRKPEPKVTKICLHCGKSFEVHPYRANTASCCSQSCAASVRTGEHAIHWQGGPVEKVCQCCGKTYKVGKASADQSHYCSRACAAASKPKGADSHAWKGGEITLICQCCYQPFFAKQAHINRAKFCSRQCHDKWRSKNKAGENSHAWQGGISFEPYPPTFNDVFKRMIRERDNNTCQICGKRGKCVHHINYVKNDTMPDNCITLCVSCHGKTQSNREYWQEHLSLRNSPAKS